MEPRAARLRNATARREGGEVERVSHRHHRPQGARGDADRGLQERPQEGRLE
jgi:hypothetical protein